MGLWSLLSSQCEKPRQRHGIYAGDKSSGLPTGSPHQGNQGYGKDFGKAAARTDKRNRISAHLLSSHFDSFQAHSFELAFISSGSNFPCCRYPNFVPEPWLTAALVSSQWHPSIHPVAAGDLPLELLTQEFVMLLRDLQLPPHFASISLGKRTRHREDMSHWKLNQTKPNTMHLFRKHRLTVLLWSWYPAQWPWNVTFPVDSP